MAMHCTLWMLLKRGLLLHQHSQVWGLQVSHAIARNGWLKDIKRCVGVQQFSSAHLHSVFCNALVSHTVFIGDSPHLFPYFFIPFEQVFGSFGCCELLLLSVAI